jgi:hypothetical protein
MAIDNREKYRKSAGGRASGSKPPPAASSWRRGQTHCRQRQLLSIPNPCAPIRPNAPYIGARCGFFR